MHLALWTLQGAQASQQRRHPDTVHLLALRRSAERPACGEHIAILAHFGRKLLQHRNDFARVD